MKGKTGRNDPCWCGSGRKYKQCHWAFDEKLQGLKEEGHEVLGHDIIKNAEEIEKIKESCKINIAVLDEIDKAFHEGVLRPKTDSKSRSSLTGTALV